MHYKLILSYDGTRYGGWQVQPNAQSIQEVLQECFKTVLRHEVLITASGRTDAGVHALNQVCHFRIEETFDLRRLQHSVNALLPLDIRIKKIEGVEEDFHARYSAKAKRYIYQLSLLPYRDPFYRLYAWHIPYRSFSLQILEEAAEKLKGVHDFKGFSNESHQGIASYDSVRNLYKIEILPKDPILQLCFEADGFLYKMVRNCVGTLVDIARGHLDVDVIDRVFMTKDRKKAGAAAPPHGLFLDQVFY